MRITPNQWKGVSFYAGRKVFYCGPDLCLVDEIWDPPGPQESTQLIQHITSSLTALVELVIDHQVSVQGIEHAQDSNVCIDSRQHVTQEGEMGNPKSKTFSPEDVDSFSSQAAEAARYLEGAAAAEGWLRSYTEQAQAPARLHDYVQHAYNKLLHSRRLRCDWDPMPFADQGYILQGTYFRLYILTAVHRSEAAELQRCHSQHLQAWSAQSHIPWTTAAVEGRWTDL